MGLLLRQCNMRCMNVERTRCAGRLSGPPTPEACSRRTWRRWPALLAALALAGCGTPLVPRVAGQAGVAVPAAWAASAPQGAATAEARTTTDLAQWWQHFQDPLLTQLVQQAQAHNTSVQAAQAALRQSRAALALAQAGSAFTLGAAGSATASRSGQASTVQSYKAWLDASWEADLFGAQRASVNAARADLGAVQANLDEAQVSVAAEVGINYLTLRGNQSRLAIARSNLASQQETAQITDWRVRAGLASSLDLEQARTAVAQTQAQLPALQLAITQGAHALAVLTGQPPAALLTQLTPAQPLPALPASLTLALPADTLRQRADVRAAEASVAAAAARVSAADAARYPSLSLSGTLGLSSLKLGSLLDADALLRSLGVSLSLPLLDGGANQATLQARQAGLDQAQAQWRAAVLTALKDVEDALVALQQDRLRLLQLQAAAESAANADLLARQRQASGLVDFSVVLETQRTLLSAQSSAAAAATDLATDHVRLYKALGGGWTPAAPRAEAAPTASTPP
jgi:NodT family efflux transporter outer membrane factor (OMF) lipoprotein